MTFIYENIENEGIDDNNNNEKILNFVPVLVPPFRGI